MPLKSFFILFFCLLPDDANETYNMDNNGPNISEVSLNLNRENNKSFYEHGFPPITTNIARILFSSSNRSTTSVIPKYTPIVHNLTEEGNLFFSFENAEYMKDINFRLYVEKHPEAANYKMNINSTVIERCNNSTECNNMVHCQVGNIHNNDELSNTTVFLSWKINNNFATIIFQYRNRLIKCQDCDSFSPDRVVLEGTEKRNVMTTHHNMSYTSKENEKNESEIILRNSLSIYVSQCYNCTLQIKLKCGENDIPRDISNNYYVFYDSSVTARGWNKTVFRPKTLDGTQNCKLIWETKYKGEKKIAATGKFWAVALIINEDNIDENNEKSLKETDENTSCNNGCKKASCSIGWIDWFFIVVAIIEFLIIIWIIYYKKRFSQQNHNSPNKTRRSEQPTRYSEIPDPLNSAD